MNDIKRCLNCGTELTQVSGKREKIYCNTTCRSNYWQKSDRLEKHGATPEEIISIIRKSWKVPLPKGLAEFNKHLLENIKKNQPTESALAEIANNSKNYTTTKGIVADILNNEKYKLNPEDIRNKFPESNKPQRSDFKNGFEYSISLAEWKEKQSKSDKTK